jgi:GMP synthase-like glutamine amidotransferase
MSELSKEADRQAEALRKDNESEEKREEKPQIIVVQGGKRRLNLERDENGELLGGELVEE